MDKSQPPELFSVGVAVEFDEPASEAGLRAALEIVGAEHVVIERVPLERVDAVVVVAVEAISESNARAQVDVALEASDAIVHGPTVISPVDGSAACSVSPARLVADPFGEHSAVE